MNYFLLICLLFCLPAKAMLAPGDPLPLEQVFNFMALPGDVQRIIQMMVLKNIPHAELKDSIKKLSHFAVINQSFHSFINKSGNTKMLVMAMGSRIKGKHELDIALGLKSMPGMKSQEVQQWIKQREQEIPLEEKLICNEDYDVLVQLIANGVDINSRSGENGRTPLLCAIGKRNIQISYIQKLFKLGASDLPCKNGKTPLMWAIMLGRDIECIEEILKHTTNINHRDHDGLTALMYGIEKHLYSVRITMELVKAGADVTRTDKKGNTPLMYAVDLKKNLNLIKELLLCNAKTVDAQDSDGETVLMKSIHMHYSWPDRAVEMVRLFLNENPNLDLRDKKGRTALQRATSIQEDIEIELMGQKVSFFYATEDLERKSNAIKTSIRLIQDKLNAGNPIKNT